MPDEITVKVTKYSDRRFWVMYYVDPVTERLVTRSTRQTTRAKAQKAAGRWEEELVEGRYFCRAKITWDEFRARYEAEHLAGLASSTAETAGTALNHVERLIDPRRLGSLTAGVLSRFQADLRAEGRKDATIDGILGHLRAALGWAVSMNMLREVPKIRRPRRPKGQVFMKGRPIDRREFLRMVAKVPEVRPGDAPAWTRYLTGLWLSGLRLEESLILSWDPETGFAIDLTGRRPRFRIRAEAEKGRRDRYLPMTPDFAQFILQTPSEARVGRVFRLEGLRTGRPITCKRVSRIVSAIGHAAGVVVDKGRGKHVSAHDLRRSFGTRWARRVMPAVLQKLMRHASIETTMRYYVDLDADELAEDLWQLHRRIEQAHGSFNTFVNSGPERAPDSDGGAEWPKSQPLPR